MPKEATTARERGVNPLNAQGSGRSNRVTARVIGDIMETLNTTGRHEQFTEDLEYSGGTVKAYTMEKGYGDRKRYTEEYTEKPDRDKKGFRWTERDTYAESVFNAFERNGIKIKKLVHHGQYD